MSLSPRQTEIMRRIARGQRDKEIAEGLGLAVSTVKGHVRICFAKLSARSRAHAAVRFLRLG